MEFSYKCNTDSGLVVGVRKLNYGLYSILVGFRHGKHKLSYHRIGFVRNGVIDMNDDSHPVPTTLQLINLLHSEAFLLILNDIKNYVVIDSIMTE